MGLDLEYFKDQTHINDLQKLNDKELYFIIRLLEDELEHFNINDGFKTKGIIRACNKTFDLFKDLRFILNGYMDVMKENDLSFCDKTDTEQLINNMDSIVNISKTINTTKTTKHKINDHMETVILKLRVLYDSMNEYITDEYNLWEAMRCNEERIFKRERYMEQDKFNTDK